jgi:hypothetical protein
VLVPYFLLFLCFRIATQEIFSKLDKTKPNLLFFQNTSWSPKQRRRGARTWPHPRAARAKPWPQHQGVSPPGPLPDAALPPIYSPRRENLKSPINFHETYCKPPPSSTRDREGPEALPGTLPERRITTGGLLHRHGCLWSDV